MKKFFKWLGIVVGSILVIALVAYTILFFVSNSRINKSYALPATAIALATDAETVAEGEHLATLFGCNSCHADNFAGAPLIEFPPLASVYASNLTTGAGGVGGAYTDDQMAIAIREGIDHNGKPLMIMPSQDFNQLSDKDTAAIIAYIRSMPPVDNVQPENSVGPLGAALLVFNQFPLLPAEQIDHTLVRSTAPERGATVEYGGYIAASCRGCHMADYAGGLLPGSEPDAVPAANLTPAGELATWTTEDFINTIRTGVNPAGHQLDPEMPWQAYASLSDDDLTAIFMYLQTLPPVERES